MSSREISNIRYGAIVGGAMKGITEGQAMMSLSSVDFIEQVGFNTNEDGTKTPVMLSFTVDKPYEVTDAEGNTKIENRKTEIEAPLLTMLPVPSLQVDRATVDFGVKINSVNERKYTTSHNTTINTKLKQGWLTGSVEVKGSYSFKKSTTKTSKSNKSYTMDVSVTLGQAELPPGMDRILSMMESSIVVKDEEANN